MPPAAPSCTPAQKNAEADLKGFDHRAIRQDVAALVVDGKGGKAVEMLDAVTVSPAAPGRPADLPG